MYLHIREKKNPSGSISVQIVDRKNRGYKVIETIGCAKNEKDLRILLELANIRLEELRKELYPNLFDFAEEKKEEGIEFISLSNDELIPIGDELIFGRMFEELGCKKLKRLLKNRYEIFKNLVISRILYPGSKLYFLDYMFYFKKREIDKNIVYRFLDTLYDEKIKYQVEKCVYESTIRKIGGKLIVCFYDVTTLHFESESEDDLRIIGFSKEGKLNRPRPSEATTPPNEVRTNSIRTIYNNRRLSISL